MDCEFYYSGDWSSLSTSQGAKRMVAVAARSRAPAECMHEGCSWTGTCGDLQQHVKSCAFASRQPSSLAGTPCGEVAERDDARDENTCRWPRDSCESCLHCSGPAPWAFGEQQSEEVQLQRGQLRNIQDRLDHIESTLEKWKFGKDELDTRIDQIEKDTNTKVEQLSRACLQLDKRLKKLQAERKTLGLGGQEGLDTALREVKDSVKDMNVTLIQGMQDKARAAEVYKMFDDVDDVLRELHDQVKICHHSQVRLCREEDHEALRAQVSHLEAELWKLHSGGAEVPAPSIGRGTAALPGNCICWNVAAAMQSIASSSRELSFSSFDRVSSSVFQALDFRGLRLAFVRKRHGTSIWDVPKSWCYLHAPKGTYLEFVMTVGDEERRFVHEFETSRSFGGVFNLPFTPNFDASDLHEGIFVQTLCEGSDGRQSAYPRIACVLEVNDAETINGRRRKVAWVTFPDGSEQAVELYWITLVQKLPPMSVVITNARKSQHFGNDVSVTSFSMRQS